jgi:hypothetical protein
MFDPSEPRRQLGKASAIISRELAIDFVTDVTPINNIAIAAAVLRRTYFFSEIGAFIIHSEN